AVETLGRHDEALAEAVVENSESGADDCLGRRVCLAAQSPGKADARSKVALIPDAILSLKAETVTQGHVGAKLPVIFRVNTGVDKRVLDEWVARDHAELAGFAAGKVSKRYEGECSVEILGGLGGVRGGAQASAEAREMPAQVQGGVILQLEVIGNNVADTLRVTAFGKRPKHADGGRQGQRILAVVLVLPLKARFIDGARAQDLGVA